MLNKKKESYKKWYKAHYKDYYLKNIKKKKAKDRAKYAYEKGLIKKEPCRDCGATKDLEKHHPDYNEPLEIVWLCRKCHKAEHKKLNNLFFTGQLQAI